jgi:hypothetical protein
MNLQSHWLRREEGKREEREGGGVNSTRRRSMDLAGQERFLRVKGTGDLACSGDVGSRVSLGWSGEP